MVGLGFSAAFDYVIMKISHSSLDSCDGSPILNVLTEFLSNRLQRGVVDDQSNEYRNFIFGVFFFFFFMNGNTERAQCALSRVCIP